MSLTIEEIQLHENLCLLGIIGGAKPLLGSQGLDLKANTFRKPSSRAIEFTIYHLYSILMGEDKAIKVNRQLPLMKAFSHAIRDIRI